MRKHINNIIKGLFDLIGFQISRKQTVNFSTSKENKYKWLHDMNIHTIIDIGAHKGEAALELYRICPDTMVYCFEPLKDIFNELNVNLKDLPNIQTFNMALGNDVGQISINRSSFTPSSSVMEMAESHKNAFPYAAESKTESVSVNTLDKISKRLILKENILLKIDVQGYEDQVIHGAKKTLEIIKLIIIETSFTKLYKNQPLFPDIYNLLNKNGFMYYGSWYQLHSPIDGRPLQQDSIFLKI